MNAPTKPTAGQPADEPAAQFTPPELAYLLGEQRLGRLATADATGAPHVVPVGWSYNQALGTIDISGRNFAATRKYRNVVANPQAAFVVDDVLPPFRPPLRPRPGHCPGAGRRTGRRHRSSDPRHPPEDHLVGNR